MKRMRMFSFEPGEVVTREGQIADLFFIVETGRLGVTTLREGDGLKTIDTMLPGQSIGDLGLAFGDAKKPGRRRATTTALEPSTLWGARISSIAKEDHTGVLRSAPARQELAEFFKVDWRTGGKKEATQDGATMEAVHGVWRWVDGRGFF